MSIQTLIALIILSLGMMLLVYCVAVEDEPGALPLLLILVSTVWLLIQHVQRLRKQRRSAPDL